MKKKITAILSRFGLSHPVVENELNEAFKKESIALLEWVNDVYSDFNRREQFAGSTYAAMYKTYLLETEQK